jgi:hypothetical protein
MCWLRQEGTFYLTLVDPTTRIGAGIPVKTIIRAGLKIGQRISKIKEEK